MRGDRGDVLLGWFTKVALVLGLFGIVSFDAVSVGVAKMNAQDTAASAAAAGAEAWSESHNLQRAYRAASAYADEHGGTIDPKAFSIDSNGTVSVRMDKDATTLLLYRTKTTKKWAHVSATAARRAV
jgi:hypothetical protein